MPSSRLRRCLRFFVLGFSTSLLAAGVFLVAVQYATHRQPEFYRQAMERGPGTQAEVGDQLERQVLTLHNDTRREGNWQASFSDQQINGWLATDFDKNFPNALPPQFQNPRVAIEEKHVRLACRYVDQPISAILSMEIDLYLTDEQNVIALQIRKARAGMLPVPLVNVLNTITDVARRAEIELDWKTFSGDPVALVTIPVQREELKQLLHLDALELRAGEVYLSGRTEINEESAAESE